MADYPLFTQVTPRTDDSTRDDRRAVVSEGGVLSLDSFYHVDDFDFVVGHDLSNAELTQLLSHHRAHTALSFNFTYQEDSLVYVCEYAGIPVYQPSESHDSIIVVVPLIESS